MDSKPSIVPGAIRLCICLITFGAAFMSIPTATQSAEYTRADSHADAILPWNGEKPATIMKLPTGCTNFRIDLPVKRGHTVNANSFGVSQDNPDNTQALQKAIDHCKRSGASALKLKKGTYRFYASAPLSFVKMDNFEFNGQGATFIFSNAKQGKSAETLFYIAECKRVLFTNFNVDWDWDTDPLASYVQLMSVDPSGAHADFLFTDYKDFPNRQIRVADIEQLNPATMSVGCEHGACVPFELFSGKTPAPRTEWLAGNLLRVYLSQSSYMPLRNVQGKTPFRMRHYIYDIAAIYMRSNEHLTISKVNVYSCPGHAFVSCGTQHHWQFKQVNIIRPEGKHRPITCTADHHHIAQSQGFFKMEDCEFSFGGDDCLNVHDCSGYALPNGKNSVVVKNQSSYELCEVGDPVELRHLDYSPTNFKAKIAGKKLLSQGGCEISFDKPIPVPKGEGFILFNWRYDSKQISVRNCYFHNNRARGLLLLGRDITVENNRFFHNQMGAIKIETGYTLDSWSEGYGASNIVIRNNTFDTVNPQGSYPNEMRPAIYMSVYLKTDPSVEKTTHPVLQDILVDNNTFLNCPGAIAYISCARNVTISNNTITINLPRNENPHFRGAVGVAYASSIYVTGNRWQQSLHVPAPGLHYNTRTATECYSWDNSLESPDP